ncbi:hypothetical protein [Larkinella harenae]
MGGISAETDSAIRAEFMANAKLIHADLIKGDFAAEKTANAQASFEVCKDALKVSQAAETEAKSQVVEARNALTTEADKRRKTEREVWIWRGLAVLTFVLMLR